MSRAQAAARGFRTWVAGLLVAVLAAIGLQLTSAENASAAPSDWNLGSYNMQGSSGGANGGNKWNTDVYPLLQGGVQVLALQEAGTVPASARLLTGTTAVVHRSDGGEQHFHLTISEWRPGGSRGATYYIYWLQTDPGANRVNIAIVTDRRADGWTTAYGGANGAGRPALGVRIGGDVIWSVHALSNGGNNGSQLLQNINAASGTRWWSALGDWNRAPDSLHGQLDRTDANLSGRVTFYRPHAATHDRAGELDYMVSNADDDTIGAEVLPQLRSDHMPVRFYTMQANAALGLIDTSDNRYLGLAARTGQNGTQVTLNDVGIDNYGGAWYLDPVGADSTGVDRYRLRNLTTNECVDLPQARSVAVQEPCDGSTGQAFHVARAAHRSQDPMILLRSTVNSSLCMAEISDPGINGVPVVLEPCHSAGTFWYWRHLSGFHLRPGALVEYDD